MKGNERYDAKEEGVSFCLRRKENILYSKPSTDIDPGQFLWKKIFTECLVNRRRL